MVSPESIDVIMCTWNSNKPYFRRCLLSIKREVNVHHIIIIDRYSSDGTLEAVAGVFPESMIFQTNANLASARRIGIAHVDTEYFAFIDADIEVSSGWFTSLISLVKSGKQIAAVQGFARYYISYLAKEQKLILGRRKCHVKEITDRGYTYNTILMTRVVRDFNPPEMIHSHEDFLLTQHIIKKGYKWLETDQAQVVHYRDAGRSYLDELQNYVQRTKWDGSGNRLVHMRSRSTTWGIVDFLLDSSKILLYCFVETILISDPRMLLYKFLGQFGYLDGFVSAYENVVPYKLMARSSLETCDE
jgi:glycosyltransferase involved in cell wall biosynthesis